MGITAAQNVARELKTGPRLAPRTRNKRVEYKQNPGFYENPEPQILRTQQQSAGSQQAKRQILREQQQST